MDVKQLLSPPRCCPTSHPFDLNHIALTLRSKLQISMVAWTCLLAFGVSLGAQIPGNDIRNCSGSCTANDVEVTNVFVGDANMVPIGGSCTIGNMVSGTLWVEIINQSMGNRSAIRIAADIYINGNDSGMDLLTCYDGPLPGGNQTVKIDGGSFSYTCGQGVELRNIKVAWRTANNATCANSTDCNNYPGGQCWQETLITVVTPPCGLTVQCPNSPTQSFSCTNPIPPAVTTVAAFEALGADIGNSPCGQIVIKSTTSSINKCSTTSVTRVYTIFDDLSPFNGMLDQGEAFKTCTLTYNYTPDLTPPTLTCKPGKTIECPADPYL
jgi:hypothetical protein